MMLVDELNLDVKRSQTQKSSFSDVKMDFN